MENARVQGHWNRYVLLASDVWIIFPLLPLLPPSPSSTPSSYLHYLYSSPMDQTVCYEQKLVKLFLTSLLFCMLLPCVYGIIIIHYVFSYILLRIYVVCDCFLAYDD